MIAQIAVQGLHNRLFDYIIPEGMAKPLPGCRVSAPFGNRKVTGIVVNCKPSSDVPVDKLKHLSEIIDDEPLLAGDVLELCQWASRYYHHALSEILFNALPVALRKGEKAKPGKQEFWELTGKENTIKSNAKKQLFAFELLSQHGKTPLNRLREAGIEKTTLRALEEKGLAKVLFEEPEAQEITPQSRHKLNTQQLQASKTIIQSLGQYQAFLLDGVTGSGKTEVYLSVIEKVLARGQSILVLVPEIGLTPQLVQRFEAFLQQPVACLHSGMSDKERLENWLLAKNGKRKILVGTRSALFTPMPNLGLVILDEEHDGSYKQQEGLRYHARDLAIVRAKQCGIPVVLGSATPSLESLANASKGNYQLLKLNERAGEGQPPEIKLVDCRQQAMSEGFSPPVLAAIEKELKSGGQVMVFINRRGYAPSLSCFDCGWIADCPQCDVKLTLHRKPAGLSCHHCGYQQQLPRSCPECSGGELQAIGIGTQRSEDFLESHFSGFKVLRLDRDKTRKKGYLQETLQQIRKGEPCLVVGTQMLAKGHDFPQLNLVVVQDADSGLFSSDYRAAEKMGQTLLQVIGRAGRAGNSGKVYIQSKLADHPYLMLLMQQDYSKFSAQLLKEREQQCLPPFFYQVLLRASSIKEQPARDFLRQLQGVPGLPEGVFFQGPWTAPIFRRANRYRYQCLLHSADRKALHQGVEMLLARIAQLQPSSAIRWSLDIDPQDMG